MESVDLDVNLQLERPDDFYEALVDMHRGLNAEQSRLVNAKLILLLSNQVGNLDVLKAAMTIAREGIAEETGEASPA